jgi:hypothetical protein
VNSNGLNTAFEAKFFHESPENAHISATVLDQLQESLKILPTDVPLVKATDFPRMGLLHRGAPTSMLQHCSFDPYRSFPTFQFLCFIGAVDEASFDHEFALKRGRGRRYPR